MVKGFAISAMMALGVLSSCTSQSDSRTATPDFTKAMKKLKDDYAKGYRDFSFDLVATAGKRVGGIPESETRFKVDGRGNAELFRRDAPGNSPEHPPGRFTGKIPDTSMRKMIDLLVSGPFENQPREFFGPWDPLEKLTINTGKHSYSFSSGSSRHPLPAAMQEFSNQLLNWTFNACPNVLWSLNLKAEQLAFERGSFSARIRLENPGPVPVRLLHPLSKPPTADFGIRLRYGEQMLIEEGYSPDPIEFKIADPEASTLDSLQWIEVSAGNPFVMDFSQRLEESASRGWIGEFTFNHHVNPDSLPGDSLFSGKLSTGDVKW